MAAKMNDKKRERVRWACRRGMLECDLFLVPFFEACYDALSFDEKILFEALLKENDVELYAWLMGTEVPQNNNYEKMLTKIRDYKKSCTLS